MQQLREQQAGRSGADDGDLSAQNVSSPGRVSVAVLRGDLFEYCLV
jgi:hypothetical protein